jgi:hypothetical protein
MPKTPDQLMEAETIIRWDESSEEAYLWTSSSKIQKEWKSFGYVVTDVSTPKWGKAWWTRVPIDRITYKPLKVK